MTEFNIEEFSDLSPAEFARLVKRTPHSTLAKVMRSQYRDRIIEKIFTTIPTMFRADHAAGVSAVIHWNITGRPDGGADAYQLAIANQTCVVTRITDPAQVLTPPRLKITMGGVEFLELIAGTTNPAMMFMMGKIKAKGDISLAATFGNLFDIPRT